MFGGVPLEVHSSKPTSIPYKYFLFFIIAHFALVWHRFELTAQVVGTNLVGVFLLWFRPKKEKEPAQRGILGRRSRRLAFPKPSGCVSEAAAKSFYIT